MSLHKIGLRYMGLTIWVESERALDQYEEASVIHSFNRDFAYMLRAVGADVRVHFSDRDTLQHRAKESNTVFDGSHPPQQLLDGSEKHKELP